MWILRFRENQDSGEKGVRQEEEGAAGSPLSEDHILGLLWMSCVTFNKWLSLCVPRFAHLSNGDTKKFLPLGVTVQMRGGPGKWQAEQLPITITIVVIPASQPTSSGTLGKSSFASGPQFPHWQNDP